MITGLESAICIKCGYRKPRRYMKMIFGDIGFCRKCAENIYSTKDMTFDGKEFIDMVVSPFLYEGTIEVAVKRFKFGGLRKYGEFLTALAVEYLKDTDFLKGADFIVPVPLHEKRMEERGFNQSEIIAKGISEWLNVPVNTEALSRTRDTLHQSSLKGRDRVENVKGAFVAEESAVSGKNIILTDDIYTMGQTTNECAKALKAAGAKRVVVFTLCKTFK